MNYAEFQNAAIHRFDCLMDRANTSFAELFQMARRNDQIRSAFAYFSLTSEPNYLMLLGAASAQDPFARKILSELNEALTKCSFEIQLADELINRFFYRNEIARMKLHRQSDPAVVEELTTYFKALVCGQC